MSNDLTYEDVWLGDTFETLYPKLTRRVHILMDNQTIEMSSETRRQLSFITNARISENLSDHFIAMYIARGYKHADTWLRSLHRKIEEGVIEDHGESEELYSLFGPALTNPPYDHIDEKTGDES